MKYFIFLCFVACASPQDNLQRAKNAVTVEQYRQQLLDCKYQGKDAGSFSVYEQCAIEADKKYGFDGGK